MVTQRDSIHILHIDDQPDVAETAAEFLERQSQVLTVDTATSASEGLSRLTETDFDCVVSDYDMPGQDGIELLRTVREDYPDLPFILYTGKGSEEVASEAISAGVTDYLQKESGTSQYEILFNRIQNAIDQRRARNAAAETEDRLQTIAENTNDILWEFSADWNELLFINTPYEEIWGRSIDELEERPRSFLDGVHPADRALVRNAMDDLSAGESVDIEYRVNADEDFGRWVWAQGEPVFDDAGEVTEVVGFARDITHRKERKRELTEKQADLRIYERAVESSTDLLAAIDTEYTFLFANERYRNFHGISRDDIGELSVPEIAGEAWETDIKPRIDRVLEGEVIRFETERTGPNGAVHSFDVRYYPLTNEGETTVGVVGSMRDITERKEHERELRDMEAKYRSITEDVLDAMEVGTIVLDADFEVVWCTEAIEAFFGVARDDVVGTDKRRILRDEIADTLEDSEGFAETVLGTYEDNTYPEQFECHVLPGDNRTERWLEHRSQPIETGLYEGGRIEMYTDITERKERERELETYEVAVETARDGIAIWDADGTYQLVNDAFVEGVGIPEAEIIGESAGMLADRGIIDETTIDRGTEAAMDLVMNDADQSTFEAVIESPTHGEMVVEVNLALRPPGPDDELVGGAVATVRPITPRKQREQELERQNERLDEFAGVVSHDLRNPLNVAQGRLQLAQADCENDHLDIAADALDRIHAMIDDLLTLARQGESVSEMEPVDLAETAETCWRNVETAEATLLVETDRSIRADKSRLQQLLANLVRNAVEHGGAGVTVRLGDLDDGFYVEDDGPGIREENRSRVFESGYSTTDEGTGFGLSIVREIAEAHGWTLSVTESDDGGARFEITDTEFTDG